MPAASSGAHGSKPILADSTTSQPFSTRRVSSSAVSPSPQLDPPSQYGVVLRWPMKRTPLPDAS